MASVRTWRLRSVSTPAIRVGESTAGPGGEPVEVLGPNEIWLYPSVEAEARAWAAAMSGKFRVDERKTGRGERTRADTPSPILLIHVTNVPSHVHRASEIAQSQQDGGDGLDPRACHAPVGGPVPPAGLVGDGKDAYSYTRRLRTGGALQPSGCRDAPPK